MNYTNFFVSSERNKDFNNFNVHKLIRVSFYIADDLGLLFWLDSFCIQIALFDRFTPFVFQLYESSALLIALEILTAQIGDSRFLRHK